MSYSKQELIGLQADLSDLMKLVNEVISEGNENEQQFAKWQKQEPAESWTYHGGTRATGAMRRKSMDVTRALARLRRP